MSLSCRSQDWEPSPHPMITAATATDIKWGLQVHDDHGQLLGTMLITMHRHEDGIVKREDRDYTCAIYDDHDEVTLEGGN